MGPSSRGSSHGHPVSPEARPLFRTRRPARQRPCDLLRASSTLSSLPCGALGAYEHRCERPISAFHNAISSTPFPRRLPASFRRLRSALSRSGLHPRERDRRTRRFTCPAHFGGSTRLGVVLLEPHCWRWTEPLTSLSLLLLQPGLSPSSSGFTRRPSKQLAKATLRAPCEGGTLSVAEDAFHRRETLAHLREALADPAVVT